DGDDHAHSGADAGNLLQGQDVGDEIGSRSAPLFRNGNAHQSELGHLVDDRPGKFVLFIHLLDGRGDPIPGEIPDHPAHHFLLVSKGEFHETSSSSDRRPDRLFKGQATGHESYTSNPRPVLRPNQPAFTYLRRRGQGRYLGSPNPSYRVTMM